MFADGGSGKAREGKGRKKEGKGRKGKEREGKGRKGKMMRTVYCTNGTARLRKEKTNEANQHRRERPKEGKKGRASAVRRLLLCDQQQPTKE